MRACTHAWTTAASREPATYRHTRRSVAAARASSCCLDISSTFHASSSKTTRSRLSATSCFCFRPQLGEAPRASGRAVLVFAGLLRRKNLFYSSSSCARSPRHSRGGQLHRRVKQRLTARSMELEASTRTTVAADIHRIQRVEGLLREGLEPSACGCQRLGTTRRQH